jgi:hypothetical protein
MRTIQEALRELDATPMWPAVVVVQAKVFHEYTRFGQVVGEQSSFLLSVVCSMMCDSSFLKRGHA